MNDDLSKASATLAAAAESANSAAARFTEALIDQLAKLTKVDVVAVTVNVDEGQVVGVHLWSAEQFRIGRGRERGAPFPPDPRASWTGPAIPEWMRFALDPAAKNAQLFHPDRRNGVTRLHFHRRAGES